MITTHFSRVRTSASFMLALFVSFSPFAFGGEKFFSWVDEQGNRHTSVIKDEANPLLDQESVEQIKQDNQKVELGPDGAANAPASSHPADPEQSVQGNADSGEVIVPDVDAREAAGTNQESASTSAPSAPATGKNGVNADAGKKQAFSVFAGEEYIDAGVLEANGFVRKETDLPYFLWRDSDGVNHYSYYKPSVRANMASEPLTPEVKTTPADEIRSKPLAGVDSTRLDPFAQKLLAAGGPGEYENYAALCCDSLKTKPLLNLLDGQLHRFLEPEQEVYVFSDGSSPYLLVKLPVSQRDYRIRIRSFVQTNRKKNLQNSVFVPQLSMLDEDFRPVRLLRRIAYHYEPETWFTYAYLEGIFEIPPRGEERYMVIHTSDAELKSGTRVEGEVLTLLNHAPIGEVEVELLR